MRYSQWCFLLHAAQEVYHRLERFELKNLSYLYIIDHEGYQERLGGSVPGVEKMLCQSFPVHKLQLSHLTSAVTRQQTFELWQPN